MGRYYDDELYHHGIKGQRWGIRRFQNKDGSYTSAGKSHRKTSDSSGNQNGTKRGLSDKQKRALKIGAVAVGSALAVYGGYKVGQHVKASVQAKSVINKAMERAVENRVNSEVDWRKRMNSKIGSGYNTSRKAVERDYRPDIEKRYKQDYKELVRKTKQVRSRNLKNRIKRTLKPYSYYKIQTDPIAHYKNIHRIGE